MPSSTTRLLIFTLIFCTTGCATVNFNYQKDETYAFTNTDNTYLGRHLKEEVSQHPNGYSGFYLLNSGIEALSARLLMAERAERSIDAQYYLIENDITGNAFIASLLRAADRGIRVRLLIDDMFTDGYDAGMLGLDSHPNFEIRVFNPFANRTFRYLGALTSFTRINRRMHNKSFTVDNQLTIFGGRNIGDAYFNADENATFYDLDVAAVGPVVNNISSMFDEYWNHERAAPLPAFIKKTTDTDAQLARIRVALEKRHKQITNTKYARAVKDTYLELVEEDSSIFTWADYKLIYDSPDKSFKSKASQSKSIITPIRNSLLNAQNEIIIASPYFVPLKSGIEVISKLQKRGVNVTIITNSHAATNQSLVQAGYAPARKPLLKNGIKIYEVKPTIADTGIELTDFSSAKVTLHTKAYIVDRKELFIGSFNFDPRSAYINTELGVIIHSPKLASYMAEKVNEALPDASYELFLNDEGKLRWREINAGQEVIFHTDPLTTWRERMVTRFLRILPIKSQL